MLFPVSGKAFSSFGNDHTAWTTLTPRPFCRSERLPSRRLAKAGASRGEAGRAGRRVSHGWLGRLLETSQHPFPLAPFL